MCKKIQYNEAFGVTAQELKKLGIFNGFVNQDAKFYITPHMLQDTKIYEFKDSYMRYKKHFSNILKLLKHSKGENDKFYKETQKMFLSPEIAHCGLGYSKNGKSGLGIGLKFAKQLTNTAVQIVNAGIEDPEIFELLGLMEEGIGADRISDMTLSILKNDFLQYTARVSLELQIDVKEFKNTTFKIPHYNNEAIIFIPEEFITALPIAIDYHDISRVCEHNETLRNKVNILIGDTFKETTKITKSQFKNLLLKEPTIAKKLVSLVKKEQRIPYNFDKDPKGEIIWNKLANDYSRNFPIKIKRNESIKNTVAIICNQYKELIENNDLFKFFHNDDGKHKNETFAQRLFFAIALSYCKANNLDISPESDSGRGPVDFKISKGYNDKVNVEMKLSTNRLIHGYETQLPIYNKAENTSQSFFLVILLYEEDTKKIEKLYKYKEKNESETIHLPEIIIIDATMKKSASKS